MPRPRKPHLVKETARNGDTIWFVRIGHGPRTRIRGAYGSPEFLAAYEAAVRGDPAPTRGSALPEPHTLAWLIDRYRRSAAWSALALATRRQRENIFRNIPAKALGEPYANITRRAIAAGRDKRASTPGQANNFLKTMRGLFGFALESGFVSTDPTQGVKSAKMRSEGFHTWTEEEIEHFEVRWPIGTRERLALAVLMFTGLRRGDAATLGRQHMRNGVITLRTQKTGKVVKLPILPELARVIAASPVGDLALIATLDGRPMTKESFGNWFADACRAAGVPGRAHGLRKAGAVRAAQNGATLSELNAIFGWSGAQMATHYTRAASDEKLAAEGIAKLSSIPAQAISARDSGEKKA